MPPSLEVLNAYVEKGLLTCDRQGPLALFNYSRETTFSSAWDDVTTASRGLVIDVTTGEVVALPWPKFFNHNEPQAKKPEGKPDEVTVKYDGSLAILYRHEGKLRWTTRGKFTSLQGQLAERLWAERYTGVIIPYSWTLLTEVLHNEGIVKYPADDLVLLGIRDRFTGRDLPYEEVAEFGKEVGLRVTEQVSAEVLNTYQDLDDQHEGFVVRWGDYRLKYKTPAYLEVARLLQGMTDRVVADYWAAGLALPAKLPEETRLWAQELMVDLDSQEAKLAEAVRLYVEPALTQGMSRKDFALSFNDGHPLKALAIRAFTGQVPDIKGWIYKMKYNGPPRPV